ncbi:MAG TPA: DUF4126 family protein [Candidatus Angelobacter sp.]|jgi:uncharacterized membrane protein
MHALAIALALGIGFVAGLRSFTAPAAISWGAYLGKLNLHNSLASGPIVGLLSILAFSEYIADLLPKTPNRTATVPLITRIITGGFSGAFLCGSANQPWIIGAVLGGIGGVIGAFAGYHARKWLVQSLHAKDAVIAIPEDLTAIALACLIVFS